MARVHQSKFAARRRRWPWLAVLIATGIALISCRIIRDHSARSNYPYVVLVSLDTLHVGSTGPYNPEVNGTPILDEFAENGVVFRHAYTRVPITLPSHTSLFSGLSPEKHGVMANGDIVPPSLTTLAEVFSAAGYRTAAFVSLAVLAERFGLDQGFDFYDDPFYTEDRIWYRYAHEVFGSVKDWLERSPIEPFFLWIHLSDPHEPYVPFGAPPDTRLTLDDEVLGEWNLASRAPIGVPFNLPPGRHLLKWTSLRETRADESLETGIRLELSNRESLAQYMTSPLSERAEAMDLKPSLELELLNPEAVPQNVELEFSGTMIQPGPSEVVDNYRKEVEYTDEYLGKIKELLDSHGIGEEVLWIIVSDHGEGLFNHSILGHAEYVFEDQLRILWMMSGNGIPRARIVDNATPLMVDVSSTLLDLVGLPVPDTSEGRSFVDCLDNGPCPAEEAWWAYALRHDTNRLSAIAGYRWPFKWIWRRNNDRRAYELEKDPWEKDNLLELAGEDRPDDVKRIAGGFRERRREIVRLLQFRWRTVDHEERLKLLRSLGYIDPR